MSQIPAAAIYKKMTPPDGFLFAIINEFGKKALKTSQRRVGWRPLRRGDAPPKFFFARLRRRAVALSLQANCESHVPRHLPQVG
jgi:hypothetical protein